MTTETDTAIPESELQTSVPATTNELNEVKQATQALVDALQGLAQAKIRSATDLTEEAYHSIEQSVQTRDKADQRWQKATHQVEDIDARLTEAAKAAWEALKAPSFDSDTAP
jgi:DNA repair ATPase RecN